MKTKYKKVAVSERLPNETDYFITNDGELQFNIHDKTFWLEGTYEMHPDWWLEEVPDHEEEVLAMLERMKINIVFTSVRGFDKPLTLEEVDSFSKDVDDLIEKIKYGKVTNQTKTTIMRDDIVCWFSGGVTSAVAIHLCIQLFGLERCRIIFIDTKNEDDDTYRFLTDCEKWYGKTIEWLTNEDYSNIEEVWYKYKGLNFAHGAICSSELKRAVRFNFEKDNYYVMQDFGFDIDEPKRAKNMTLNYPKSRCVYPLLMFGWSKKRCIEELDSEGIKIPRAYKWGFNNNNCLKTGCVQGGIGYWQLYGRLFPDRFDRMAEREHELTNLKGEPVTMLRVTIGKERASLFLKPHPEYAYLPKFEDQKGRPPRPLTDCNGHCSVNDGIKNETVEEINFQEEDQEYNLFTLK